VRKFSQTAANQGGDGNSAAARDINFDPYAGFTLNDKPILPLTGEESVLSHLFTGQTIGAPANGVITYGFYTGNHAVGGVNNPHSGEGKGYSPFSAEQKAAAIASIQLWDDLIPQTFVNVGDVGVKGWAHNDATILFANTSTGPAQAWAYYPGGDHQYKRTSSDVWTADPAGNPSNMEFEFGQYGRTTLIHEIGHTLGLSHPGNYNGSGATTYEDQAEYFQDSQQYTIMSYWGAWNTGGAPLDWNFSGGLLYDNSPQGPMLHDIMAIQAAYGADTTTRSGDTTYGFNSNAGNALYDFSVNSLPYFALYDAGGSDDTIDLSGFNSSQYINLTPGAFSSIGDVTASAEELGQALHDAYLTYYGVDLYAAGHTNTTLGNISLGWLAGAKTDNAGFIEDDTGVSDIGTVNYENFAIAYNTTIENAIGGSARDYLVGNDVSNRLDGSGGDDVLNGLAGDDFLIGGAGSDEFQFTDLGGTDEIVDFVSGTDKIDLRGIDGNAGAAGDQAFSFIGNADFSNVAGELRAYSADGDNFVAGDVNGDGVADFIINLGGSSAVASDFFL
jgi:serralysin